jgi:hypothetical protein
MMQRQIRPNRLFIQAMDVKLCMVKTAKLREFTWIRSCVGYVLVRLGNIFSYNCATNEVLANSDGKLKVRVTEGKLNRAKINLNTLASLASWPEYFIFSRLKIGCSVTLFGAVRYLLASRLDTDLIHGNRIKDRMQSYSVQLWSFIRVRQV